MPRSVNRATTSLQPAKSTGWVRLAVLPLLFACVALGFSSCSGDSAGSPSKTIKEVDFTRAMGGKELAMPVVATAEDMRRITILKTLYDEQKPSKMVSVTPPKIPKIIHQIWLGPKVPPPYFKRFQEKWLALHPDWEYRLWTELDLDNLDLELRDLIDESPNYAEKSDILRCEILERFGGMYVDVDMEPLQPLDALHEKYDFYAGVEHPHPIATVNEHIWVGISILASRPQHPIMVKWRQNIREAWKPTNHRYSSPVERVINHTYFPFNRAFFDECRTGGFANIAFPTTYFYPISPENAGKRRSTFRSYREKLYDFLESCHLMQNRPFARVRDETLAVHFWGNTWLGNPGEQIKDMQNQLDYVKAEILRLQDRVRKFEGGDYSPFPEMSPALTETSLSSIDDDNLMGIDEEDAIVIEDNE